MVSLIVMKYVEELMIVGLMVGGWEEVEISEDSGLAMVFCDEDDGR